MTLFKLIEQIESREKLIKFLFENNIINKNTSALDVERKRRLEMIDLHLFTKTEIINAK